MRNIKKILTTLTLVSILPSQILAATFSDVSAQHPQYNAIEFLKTENIISGYPDGTFQPNKIVNRAEALKIIMTAAKIAENSNGELKFSDVKAEDWFYKYINAAFTKKIVNGNPDGTFAPGREVNKVEFLKMLLLSFDVVFKNYQPPKSPLYPDTPNNQEWFIQYIDFAKNLNLITPNSAGNIEPSKGLTRAQVAEITYKFLIILKNGPTQLLLSRAEAKLIQAVSDMQKLNFNEAEVNIKDAKSLATEALKLKPDEAVVKAANNVIDSFQSLIEAFKFSADKKYDEAIKKAGEAYNKADQAIAQHNSVENLGNQVKAAAKSLADQMRAAKGS